LFGVFSSHLSGSLKSSQKSNTTWLAAASTDSSLANSKESITEDDDADELVVPKLSGATILIYDHLSAQKISYHKSTALYPPPAGIRICHLRI
jgi:hypothetical protein